MNNNQAHRNSIKWGEKVAIFLSFVMSFWTFSIYSGLSSQLLDRVSSLSAAWSISPRNKWQARSKYFVVEGRRTFALQPSFAMLFSGSLTRRSMQPVQWSCGSTKRPLAYTSDWKNVVGRTLQTINDTTQWFAGKHLNYLLICIFKAVHLHCLSVLISHFVRPSLVPDSERMVGSRT